MGSKKPLPEETKTIAFTSEEIRETIDVLEFRKQLNGTNVVVIEHILHKLAPK